jgi:hypothetical protein
MKLWIIALAISATAGCGHDNNTEEKTAGTPTEQAPPAPVSNPDTNAGPSVNMGPVDTAGLNVPGQPANAPKPKPEKPKPRPKPEVIDFTK